ncbi:fasciclin domain-containing protein [Mucilaginibacter gynuensis]|uniref:Fasciclin domain-containing protein n=2 Tax=Mucilaginibacter gynuensis TaxID=1302236 RepID=A0ABP8FLV9_9SPHI
MKNLIIVCACLLLALNSCKRDGYYEDGGKANPNFNGDMLAYLESKPVPFDTIAQIVKLAGLEETFRTSEFTFFALDDDVIKRTIGDKNDVGSLNWQLFFVGKDTVKALSDINPLIWKKYLQRYMFTGVNRLKDYPQIDLGLQSLYPGGLYYSLSGTVCNIGAVYNDVNGVKYLGYRNLSLSYVYDLSNPDDKSNPIKISSSDIKPKNGIVHTLSFSFGYFGFNPNDFMLEVYNSGLTTSN